MYSTTESTDPGELGDYSIKREDIEELFAKPSSKEDIYQFLGRHATKSILLEHPVVSVEQAVKDFKREKVVLNGVAFVPDANDIFRFSCTFCLSHFH